MAAALENPSHDPQTPVSSPKPPNGNPRVQDIFDASQPRAPRSRKVSAVATKAQDGDDAAWGSNFWVTLVDPQTQTSFFACPATGQVSWDPPVGNFVLPPSEAGEWWELLDEARGLPYYYQTKTGATVWERPEGFVIPLGIIQNTALARRLSQTRFSRFLPDANSTNVDRPSLDALRTSNRDRDPRQQVDQSPTTRSASKRPSPLHKSRSGDPRIYISQARPHLHVQQLTPIPSSDASVPPSPSRRKSNGNIPSPTAEQHRKYTNEVNGNPVPGNSELNPRIRTKSSPTRPSPYRPQQPQSLNAALEMINISTSESGNGSSSPKSPTISTAPSSPSEYRSTPVIVEPTTPTKGILQRNGPSGALRAPSNALRSTSAPTVGGKVISSPIPNPTAMLEMSPIKDRLNGKPILVHPRMNTSVPRSPTTPHTTPSTASGNYPTLPADLATEIQEFADSEFARQYFSTHRTGFIFKRRVPVSQMMTWQKTPLSSPLLALNRSLNKEAIKVFKVIQSLMGDRDREKSNARVLEMQVGMAATNASTTSLAGSTMMLEEERWLLTEGLTHGELRDEIFCQLMKQLTGNPNTESVFKGWQLLCVLLITFPPSKNFETYLSSFILQYTTQQEGRVDVMAKYCLRRLMIISRKGPRGKPPSIAEIEAASDAAFHPSTFGESLDAILRLQERKYPQQKVPIILPFLANGILALGGPRVEGIFRIPGDSDSVAELKLRIDQGYYTIDSVNDPHVLASLMKLWLRELLDPLIPEEMYNECITSFQDADACVRIIERLPTINRRVVLFVVSFLQLFLEERVQSATKMTPANLALVMAPNLLRCSSDSMSVVFTNAQYEQIFVYNLLLNLQCGQVDPDYIPVHGLEAAEVAAPPRVSKSRSRRL